MGHRRSQGVHWVHMPPRAEKKNFCRRNLQGNFSSAPAHQGHSQAEQESILGHFFLRGGYLEVGVVHSVYFRASFEGDD